MFVYKCNYILHIYLCVCVCMCECADVCLYICISSHVCMYALFNILEKTKLMLRVQETAVYIVSYLKSEVTSHSLGY